MVPPEAPPEAAAVVVPPVSNEEFDTVRDRLQRKKKAPGPDGVPLRMSALALEHLEKRHEPFRQLRHILPLWKSHWDYTRARQFAKTLMEYFVASCFPVTLYPGLIELRVTKIL
ncbi:hypothetical protein ACJJTC_009326 [Scirpophaga incertulas]